jgi:hypothetical protein
VEDTESYSSAAVERAMKVQKVSLRAVAKKITWWQAAVGRELGLYRDRYFDCNVRHLREAGGRARARHWAELHVGEGGAAGRGLARGRKHGIHRKRRARRAPCRACCWASMATDWSVWPHRCHSPSKSLVNYNHTISFSQFTRMLGEDFAPGYWVERTRLLGTKSF